MGKDRHFGLDVVRTLAITFVFISHAGTISQFLPYTSPDVIKNLSIPDGVDLFFVLSGFLIGRILLKTNFESGKNIFRFWKRRWLRTLPNYFLFLLVNLILLWLTISPGLLSHAVLYYFVFLQNLYKPVDVFFWESWSLSVEEWFYLLFPLVLLFLYKLKKDLKVIFLITILFFFVFSICSKLYFQTKNPELNFDLYQRILVVNRFDTLCFGLVLAWLDSNYPALMTKLKWPGIMLFLLYLLFGKTDPHQHPVLYFTLSAVGCSGLLLFCYGFARGAKIATLLFETLSKISYSIYLIHLPVLYCFNYLTHKNYGQAPMLYLLSYTGIVLLLSFLNYRYFELYFLRKREL